MPISDAERRSNETIGQRIRRLRLARGLSLRQLAVPGVSFSYLSRIEQGDRAPSVGVIRRVARRLGVSPEYLETGVELTTREELELALSEAELKARLDPAGQTVEADLRAVVTLAQREGEPDIAAKARATLGMALFNWGRLPEAATSLESAVANPLMRPDVVPDVYMTLVRVYAGLDRMRDAVTLCERALAVTHPDDRMRRIVFATHLSNALSELGEYERAEQVLHEFEDELADVDPYAQARLHWSLAQVATVQEQRRLALRHMRRAIELLRGSEDTERVARAHMMYAEILLWGGTTLGVGKHLAAARKLLPPSAEANTRGRLRSFEALLAAREDRIPEARAAAADALRLIPESGTGQSAAIYAQALVAKAHGDFDRANELFAQTIKLRLELKLPREAAVIAEDAARARAAAGDDVGARAWLEQAAEHAANARRKLPASERG